MLYRFPSIAWVCVLVQIGYIFLPLYFQDFFFLNLYYFYRSREKTNGKKIIQKKKKWLTSRHSTHAVDTEQSFYQGWPQGLCRSATFPTRVATSLGKSQGHLDICQGKL